MLLRRHRSVPGLREAWIVWSLFAVTASAIFATYSRLPVHELYHVSEDGRVGGAGRVLVFLNFSTALAAIPIVAVVIGVARSRASSWVGVAAIVMCAAVAWPGVVDQSDLDARWVNAIAATGVLLALALTVAATLRYGIGPRVRVGGDRARVLAAVVLTALALPWIVAELGFLIGRWPGLGSIFYSDEWYAPFGQARLHRAVHAGHHHGLDGTLLALTSILLSRTLALLRPPARGLVGGYLALLLVYGLGNIANDFWLEQLVKRGVTSWQFPSLLIPSANLSWLILCGLAVLAYVVLFRRVPRSVTIDQRPWLWPLPAGIAIVAFLVVGLVHGGQHHRTPLGSIDGVAFAYAPEGAWHIYVTGHGELVRLTNGDHTDLAPKWSPDGRLLFQSNRDGKWELYSLDPGGAGVRRLTRDDGSDGEPAPSPRGGRIAFVHSGDLYVMSARGPGARKVADRAAWPTWSADGRSLAYEVGFASHHGIAVSRPGRSLGEYGAPEHRHPDWSPRAAEIAYECLMDDHWHICLLNPRTGSSRALTQGHFDEFAPAWSSDGRRIAFISDRDGPDQLYVMRADGTDIIRLTSGQGDKDTPAWRP